MPGEDTKKKTGSSLFGGLLKSAKRQSTEDLTNGKKFFGVALNSLLDHHTSIPRPLKECLDILSDRCETEGLFRISASQKDLEMAKIAAENDLPLSFKSAQTLGQEHIAAAIVKLFLRELPTSIVPGDFRCVEELRLLKKQIEALPRPNYILIKEIFRVLQKVARASSKSKMDASNLALVIGPNLMWYCDEQSGERISPSDNIRLAFRLIDDYDHLFRDNCPVSNGDHPEIEGECEDSNENYSDNESTEEEQNYSDILVSAIYELQKEIYHLKSSFEEEVKARKRLESLVRENLSIESFDCLASEHCEESIGETSDTFQ